MSIPYDTDDKTPAPQDEGLLGGMSEYERRSEKARKELEDYLEHERSMKRQTSSHEGSLRRQNFLEGEAVPEKEEQEKMPLESEDDCLHRKWWTKTDHASLNDAPDKILDEEANTKHIDDHYSYIPQFEASGYIPPYMQKAAADAAKANAPPLKSKANAPPLESEA